MVMVKFDHRKYRTFGMVMVKFDHNDHRKYRTFGMVMVKFLLTIMTMQHQTWPNGQKLWLSYPPPNFEIDNDLLK